MRHRLLQSALALALAACATLAVAQEPPSRVGRMALVQGQVQISGAPGEAAQAAMLNWPVNARDLITTARGARAELRIGSTAVQLDGDSSLEVVELDDDSLRLRLHYGSVSVRVSNPEVLAGFELATPEGRVRLQQPGRVRVDADRVPDTAVVSVLDGAALVEGGGASLTLRAGKRAELRDDDVRTTQASRDGFDDWAAARDRIPERVVATRYVTTEMTGYEELDRYGSWRVDSEYGAIWMPTVSAGWTPYRDGRWAWIDPWGWTWVDNAPWGYAPFHYGRWVHVHNRWAWAPGRREPRPVWAPAWVGWVGGDGWAVDFRQHNRHQPLPARGWYPLSPRDRYEPHYRVSDDYLRRLNAHQLPDPRPGHRPPPRREGLTVVPQDHFGQRGPVVVPRAPLAVVPPRALPAATPPAPPRDWRRDDRWDGRRDARPNDRNDARRDERPQDRNDMRRDDRPQNDQRREGWQNERNDGRRDGRADDRRDPRGRFEPHGNFGGRPPVTMPAPIQPVPAPRSDARPPAAPQPMPPVAQPVQAAPQQPPAPRPEFRPDPRPDARPPAGVAAPAQVTPPPRWREEREEQFEDNRRAPRHQRGDGDAPPRPAPRNDERFAPPPSTAVAPPRPAPVAMPAPVTAAPAPTVVAPAPRPAPAAVAPPAPRPAAAARTEERRHRGEDGPVHQQER